MARWLDPIRPERQHRLKLLLRDLREVQPLGWSSVWRENEISIRPLDRRVGKFSITPDLEGGWRVAFFCRELNIWNKGAYFPDDSEAAPSLMAWMLREVQQPLRHVSSG